MKSFLEQSNGPKNKYLDGFGLAGKTPGKEWNLYTNEISYPEMVKHRPEVIQQKISDIAQNEVVVGHIRKKNIGEQSLQNTQPFFYENQIFCHNGLIESFYGKKKNIQTRSSKSEFMQIIPSSKDDSKIIQTTIQERIHPLFVPLIQGETDSEYLFYLYLTFKQEIEEKNPDKKSLQHLLLQNAMKQMIAYLETLQVLIYLNIIYCNDEYSIITRYVIHKNKDPSISAPTLYYNKDNGFIVSSDPILQEGSIPQESVLVQENTILIIKL